MARAPDERYEPAKVMYLKGIKLVEIASQLNLPEGTVRRWKSTHKWESERSDNNSERSVKKVSVRNKKEKAVAIEIEQVLENPDLNDKQRLFCLHYIKCFNATKAYQKAYGADYATAASISYRLLEHDGVKNEIAHLKQNRLNREMLGVSDIFQKYMDIAFSDITDYVEFGREEVQVMGPFGPIEVKDEVTGDKKAITKVINTVRFKEHTEVDGTLITEVKQGKDGASIKLADRMKALDWVASHMDLATEEQRARIDALKSKVDSKSPDVVPVVIAGGDLLED